MPVTREIREAIQDLLFPREPMVRNHHSRFAKDKLACTSGRRNGFELSVCGQGFTISNKASP
jgi:hypothetical protein